MSNTVTTEAEIKPFFLGKFSGYRGHQAHSTYLDLLWMLQLAGIGLEKSNVAALACHKVAADAVSQIGDQPTDSKVSWGKVKKDQTQGAKEENKFKFSAIEATRWAQRAQKLRETEKQIGVTFTRIELAKEDATWFDTQAEKFSLSLKEQGYTPTIEKKEKKVS